MAARDPRECAGERRCRARRQGCHYEGFGKRKPWWDCETVLQSKEQERKPLTYSAARPISIRIGGNAKQEAYTGCTGLMRREWWFCVSGGAKS
jgi:hypothetical protein